MDESRPFLIPAWYREMIWGRPRQGIKLGEIWFRAHPLLLKFIFSDEKLSVQVHPSDEYALPRESSLGKTECWTILEAEPGAALAVGLKREMTGKQILAAIEDGSIERELNWMEVHPGDFIFLPWGTVHALGPGITLCEVQEFSDLTYRMYDYGRGRPLHLDKALDVIRQHPAAGRLAPARLESGNQCRDMMVACRHFVVERFTSATERADTVHAPHAQAGFEVLIFLEGAGEIVLRGERYTYQNEQMWYLPRKMGDYCVTPGRATTWLKVHVPASLEAVRDELARAGLSAPERSRIVIEDV